MWKMVFHVCICCSTSGHYRSCVLKAVCVRMPSPFSSAHLFVTLWTVACQAPLAIGFSRQKYWSGLPCRPPGDLPDPGIGSASRVLCLLQWEAGSLPLVPPGKPLSRLYTPSFLSSLLLFMGFTNHRASQICRYVSLWMCSGLLGREVGRLGKCMF